MNTNEQNMDAEPSYEDLGLDGQAGLLAEVADSVYDTPDPMGEEDPSAPLSPPGGELIDLFGEQLVELIRAEIAAALASHRAEIRRDVAEDLKEKFKPLRAYAVAARAKAAEAAALAAEEAFVATHPLAADPAVRAEIEAIVSAMPALDRSDAYTLALKRLKRSDAAAVSSMSAPVPPPTIPMGPAVKTFKPYKG